MNETKENKKLKVFKVVYEYEVIDSFNLDNGSETSHTETKTQLIAAKTMDEATKAIEEQKTALGRPDLKIVSITEEGEITILHD